MSEVTNTQSASSSNFWDVIQSDMQPVATLTEVTTEQNQTKDTVAEGQTVPELNVEEQKPEPTQENPAENKPENSPETTTTTDPESQEEKLELTIEDFKNPVQTFKEGSLQHLAQQFDLKLENESPEDFVKLIKENHVSKTEAEKFKTEGRQLALSKFQKAETATLIEMRDQLPDHIPDEVIFNPTGKMDYLLSLPDEQLVRQLMTEAVDQNGNRKYSDEVIDTEMELLAEKGHISHKANMHRDSINESRTKLLQWRDSIFQEQVQKRQQAELNQKQEKDNQFKKSLDNASTFLGHNLSKETKDVIWNKYSKGDYDNVLNSPENLVNAVYLFEFGEKIVNTRISKAKSEAKAEVMRNLSDVPPKQQASGSTTQIKTEETTDSIEKVFGIR